MGKMIYISWFLNGLHVFQFSAGYLANLELPDVVCLHLVICISSTITMLSGRCFLIKKTKFSLKSHPIKTSSNADYSKLWKTTILLRRIKQKSFFVFVFQTFSSSDCAKILNNLLITTIAFSAVKIRSFICPKILFHFSEEETLLFHWVVFLYHQCMYQGSILLFEFGIVLVFENWLKNTK